MSMIVTVRESHVGHKELLERLSPRSGALSTESNRENGALKTLYTETIPGKWHMGALGRIAAGLALHQSLPDPYASGTVLDSDLQNEYSCRWYDEEVDLPYSHLLQGNVDGIYIPEEFELSRDLDGSGTGYGGTIVGSSFALLTDCRDLAERLGIPHRCEGILERARTLLYSGASESKGWERYPLESFVCTVLKHAAEISIANFAPIILETRFDEKPVGEPLIHAEASYEGFVTFAGSSVSSNGTAVEVTFDSGYSYLIPLAYVLSWSRGGSKPVRELPLGLKIQSSRALPPDKSCIRLYLSDGTTRDLFWDAVLEACEPFYEFFGGTSPQRRESIFKWMSQQGPFRLAPSPRRAARPQTRKQRIDDLVKRCGGTTARTNLFENLPVEITDPVSKQAELLTDEAAFLASFRNLREWTLLTSERLVWRSGPVMGRLNWVDVRGAQQAPDVAASILSGELSRNDAEVLEIFDSKDDKFSLRLESGDAYFLVWRAIGVVGNLTRQPDRPEF